MYVTFSKARAVSSSCPCPASELQLRNWGLDWDGLDWTGHSLWSRGASNSTMQVGSIAGTTPICVSKVFQKAVPYCPPGAITCRLVPRNVSTTSTWISHFPLGSSFFNLAASAPQAGSPENPKPVAPAENLRRQTLIV